MTEEDKQLIQVKFTPEMIPPNLKIRLNIIELFLGLLNFIGINFLIACINEIANIMGSNAHSVSLLL
jgi:hypothetical protein